MRTRITVTLLVLVTFGFHTTASAFDWNGQTVLAELDVSFGKMSTDSGHPLATLHGFHKAVFLAKSDQKKAAALMTVLQAGSLDELLDGQSDPVQTVLFGSWLNEIRTNIDAEGSFALDLAAKLLRFRYRHYLDGRVHSDRWTEETRYTSSNYQHSMMVTSTDPKTQMTQDNVFAVIENYMQVALTIAIANLVYATKGREDGSLDEDQVDLEWVSGLRWVGSVFHMVEDSSVACTDAAKLALAARKRSCVVGDGHGIVKMTPDGLRVVALSDNAFYEREVADGSKPHAELDDLYQKELIDALYGTFDPSFATGELLVDVTLAVRKLVDDTRGIPIFNPDGSKNLAWEEQVALGANDAAFDIAAKLFNGRYAKKEHRTGMPPLPGGEGDDKADGEGSRDDDAAGCSMGGHATGAAAALVFAMIAMATRRRRRW